MPRVFVQGSPVDSYPRPAPEAGRGSVRRVTEVGEEVLHRPCRDVTEFGPDLAALIDDMFLTMYVADGRPGGQPSGRRSAPVRVRLPR